MCVSVCVCVCEGEVRGLRGDDMHVSRLLTSLRIIRLVGCPPPSHDGHSGNSPLSLHWCWCWLWCLWCASLGWLFVCVFSGGGLFVVQVRNGTGHADVTCHTHTHTHTYMGHIICNSVCQFPDVLLCFEMVIYSTYIHICICVYIVVCKDFKDYCHLPFKFKY